MNTASIQKSRRCYVSTERAVFMGPGYGAGAPFRDDTVGATRPHIPYSAAILLAPAASAAHSAIVTLARAMGLVR
jgi:hypothetical protein